MTADICMIVHNGVTGDGRVLKEATSLARQGWRVVVVGLSLSGPILPETETVRGFTVLRVTPRLWRRALPGTAGNLLRAVLSLPMVAYRLRQVNARAYHAHDFPGLLIIALAGIWRRPVIYDSHELFFDRWAGVRYPLKHTFPFLRPLEKILAKRAAGIITVSDNIADRLAQTLGVPRPVVVHNAFDTRVVEPPAAVYETGERKTVVHSGSIVGGRHLPELVAALAHLPDDVALVLMGAGWLRAQLISQAEDLGVAERLVIVPPVPLDSVAATLAQADAAAVLVTSRSLHYDLTLPNKLFEAVAAGLPLVASPTTANTTLVQQYDLGVICDPTDPSAIAAAIHTVLQPENQARYRANARQAREVLNWEAEERKLVALYRDVLNQRQTASKQQGGTV